MLDNHDGQLLPTLDVREQVIREIRGWKADLVLAPRPNDYHPDHRYTGVLVQDAAYMVVVPHLIPEVPALRKNPVFMYYEDGFQRPNPFRPDIAVRSMTSSIRRSTRWILTSHSSTSGSPGSTESSMKSRRIIAERKMWLKHSRTRAIKPDVRAALIKWYGPDKGGSTQYYEAFEICEYGARPDDARIRQLFPMLGN